MLTLGLEQMGQLEGIQGPTTADFQLLMQEVRMRTALKSSTGMLQDELMAEGRVELLHVPPPSTERGSTVNMPKTWQPTSRLPYYTFCSHCLASPA
jgi:hypothetical protein